ncbi:hypothetical protein CEXT_36301 [Caerostris extrusa]|uniref:Uncharacterized protein n=1 Tax=Caerostris extrusa TaxID=172846 RepID=A0AAV4T0R5_CAEEX|nr:hypothetical protein CEXT_36301 [Caerostris extrusa]
MFQHVKFLSDLNYGVEEGKNMLQSYVDHLNRVLKDKENQHWTQWTSKFKHPTHPSLPMTSNIASIKEIINET